MGIGPIPAVRKLLGRLGKKVEDFDVIELNEAFAAQALACVRDFGLPDDSEKATRRRRHRPRPPAGHERRAHRADHRALAGKERRQARPGDMCVGVGRAWRWRSSGSEAHFCSTSLREGPG